MGRVDERRKNLIKIKCVSQLVLETDIVCTTNGRAKYNESSENSSK
jgi:hypothetical protein